VSESGGVVVVGVPGELSKKVWMCGYEGRWCLQTKKVPECGLSINPSAKCDPNGINAAYHHIECTERTFNADEYQCVDIGVACQAPSKLCPVCQPGEKRVAKRVYGNPLVPEPIECELENSFNGAIAEFTWSCEPEKTGKWCKTAEVTDCNPIACQQRRDGTVNNRGVNLSGCQSTGSSSTDNINLSATCVPGEKAVMVDPVKCQAASASGSFNQPGEYSCIDASATCAPQNKCTQKDFTFWSILYTANSFDSVNCCATALTSASTREKVCIGQDGSITKSNSQTSSILFNSEPGSLTRNADCSCKYDGGATKLCPAQSMTWTVANKTCSANAAETQPGATVNLSDDVAPATGIADFKCEENGVWASSPNLGATCSEDSCKLKAATIGSYYFSNQNPQALFSLCSSTAWRPGDGCTSGIYMSCYQAGFNQNNADPKGAPVLYKDDGTAAAICGTAAGTPTATKPSANLCARGIATGVLDRGTIWTWACHNQGGFGQPVECDAAKDQQAVGRYQCNNMGGGAPESSCSNRPEICSADDAQVALLEGSACNPLGNEINFNRSCDDCSSNGISGGNVICTCAP
jgi:hypothetical protein